MHFRQWTLLLGVATLTMTVSRAADHGTLFQASTISALLDGDYDGHISCGTLKTHGDFGIGTFDRLDGEMIELDGQVYQVNAQGKVCKMPDDATLPFAAVTWFESDMTFEVAALTNFDALRAVIDQHLPSKNIFYAIRVTGEFSHVKTRSVPKQSKPYPRLAEVTKTEPVFEYGNIKGTLVGFWCPDFAQGVNVPGYHLHFLADDHSGGGHLLDCRVLKAEVSIDTPTNLYLVLPENVNAAMSTDPGKRAAELKKAEQ